MRSLAHDRYTGRGWFRRREAGVVAMSAVSERAEIHRAAFSWQGEDRCRVKAYPQGDGGRDEDPVLFTLEREKE